MVGRWHGLRVGLLLASGLLLQAQPAAEPPLKLPPLVAGEALAIGMPDGNVKVQGDATRESPMGGLARLVWMKVEGANWATTDVRFTCTGRLGELVCTKPKGHGRMTYGRAVAEGCDLAFLAWMPSAMATWRADYGDEVARSRMEEAFGPFLGNRVPKGETLPAPSAVWLGAGDLLRASPDRLVRWLMEPERAEVLTDARRYLSGFMTEFRALAGKESWWYMPMEVGSDRAHAVWVVGGRADSVVVLRRMGPEGIPAGLARFKALLDAK